MYTVPEALRPCASMSLNPFAAGDFFYTICTHAKVHFIFFYLKTHLNILNMMYFLKAEHPLNKMIMSHMKALTAYQISMFIKHTLKLI